jgi:hypothetical protein
MLLNLQFQIGNRLGQVVDIRSTCRQVCQATLLANVEALGKTANSTAFDPATRFEEDVSDDDDHPEDDQNETLCSEQFVRKLKPLAKV